MASPLSQSQLDEWRARGSIVLRGLLRPEEVTALAATIKGAFEAGEYEASKNPEPYPAPGNHALGCRILSTAPQVLPLSADHPAILAAAEQLLGDSAVLSQYVVYMRTPGAGGTGAGSKERPGGGTHYDYKPWRPVGSFLNWLFVIIPLVDYTETSGPLLTVPGTHTKTQVLPSDGRVHRVRCATLPSEEEAGAELADPHLRKGDVLLMHGFTWHEAWPNRSDHDRFGVYIKLNARSSPPAAGPVISPWAARERCRESTAETLLAHTRSDGRHAGIRRAASGTAEPVPTIDSASLIFERADGMVLAVRHAGGWALPATPDGWLDEGVQSSTGPTSIEYLDCGNVIESVQIAMREAHGLKVPWMSWVADKLSPPSPAPEQRLHRVYAYRPAGEHFAGLEAFSGAAAAADGQTTRWIAPTELGEEEATWVRMWQDSTDASGRAVMRGVGVPQSFGVRNLADMYHVAGKADGDSWMCVDFDDKGEVVPPPALPDGHPRKAPAGKGKSSD